MQRRCGGEISPHGSRTALVEMKTTNRSVTENHTKPINYYTLRPEKLQGSKERNTKRKDPGITGTGKAEKDQSDLISLRQRLQICLSL